MTLRNASINCFILLFSILSVACVATSGNQQATTITAPEATPGRYKTFAWYQDRPAAAPEFEKGYTGKLDEQLRQSIEAELLAKGYTKAAGRPDVLVAYDVSVSVPVEKDKPENFAPGFGYSYGYMAGYRYKYNNSGMPGYRAVDLFKKGTLIIDLISPATEQLLWRGWTEEAFSNFNPAAGAVKKEVNKVLAPLPPVRQ